MFKITAILLGLVLVVGLGADAKDWESVDAFKLRPQFAKINQALVEALPNDRDDKKKNMDFVVGMMAKKSSGLSGKMGLHKSMTEALELFTSLQLTAEGKCNSDNQLILLKNWQAISVPGGSNLRTKKVMDAYYSDYVDACRSFFEKRYHELVEIMDPKSLARVKNAFQDLTLEDCDSTGAVANMKSANFLISQGVFSASTRSTHHVVNRIAELMEEEEPEKDLRNAVRFEGGQSRPQGMSFSEKVTYARENKEVNPRPTMPKEILDKYLLDPCTAYRRNLAEALDPALFESQMMNGKDLEELMSNKEYYDALVFNRLCRSLLKDRSKVYDVFTKPWLNRIGYYS